MVPGFQKPFKWQRPQRMVAAASETQKQNDASYFLLAFGRARRARRNRPRPTSAEPIMTMVVGSGMPVVGRGLDPNVITPDAVLLAGDERLLLPIPVNKGDGGEGGDPRRVQVLLPTKPNDTDCWVGVPKSRSGELSDTSLRGGVPVAQRSIGAIVAYLKRSSRTERKRENNLIEPDSVRRVRIGDGPDQPAALIQVPA